MLPDDLFARLSRESARRLRYTPAALASFADWTSRVRARLGDLLRSDLWPSSPLVISVGDREQGEGFVRERIEFEAGPLFSGSAYLLIPEPFKRPVPGILCLHGHGGYMAGKDMVAGVVETHPIARECAAALNYGYGVQLAQAGFVTLCPDAFNFGERLFAKHRWTERHVCNDYAQDLQLYGYNLIGITVGTNVRLIDYLLARPEVSPGGVGCVGLSYGGIQAVFTMAMDERIQAGVVSGALHSMADLKAVPGGGAICSAQIVPGMLEWFDFDDLARSLAPRPVFYELMQRDCCFDFRSSRAVYEQVAGVYRALGVPERTCLESPDTDHRYSGVNVPEFLKRNLGPESETKLPSDKQASHPGPGENDLGNFPGARRTITGDDYDGRLVLRSPRNP